MAKPWYDDRLSIPAYLGGLADLNLLIEERIRAGYDRGERLTDYVILGRFTTDSVGNFSKLGEWIPADHIPDMPEVITFDDFWRLAKQRNVDEPRLVSQFMRFAVPPAEVLCAYCGVGWTIKDCHDCIVDFSAETLLLDEFATKPVSEVKEALARRVNGVYELSPELTLHNDKLITLENRIGEQKASAKDRRLDPSYVVQPGDQATTYVFSFYHSKCHQRKKAVETEKEFRNIFEFAGFRIIGLVPIPNRYHNHETCNHCAPWYSVITDRGTFVIGWRKRVINIDWNGVTTKNLLELFRDEDVTKDAFSIHAWGPLKAVDYLGRIRRELPLVA